MASKYQVNNHSVLNVTKQEAQQGRSWHDLARGRAQKQHGEGEEIPEGDIHAVVKLDNSTHLPQVNQEENKVAIGSLEERLKQIQAQRAEEAKPVPQQPEQNQYDEDVYDEWLKQQR